MRWRPPLELLLLGAVACRRAGPGDADAPLVVAVVEVVDAAPIHAVAASSAGTARAPGCAFEAEADAIVPSSASCTIYEQLTSGGGRVFVPCGGADGPALATFGAHEYRGFVHNGQLTLKHAYELDEEDGCSWRIHGRISGKPTAEGGRLAWSYEEEILEDDTSHCWATCTARTAIRLAPVR